MSIPIDQIYLSNRANRMAVMQEMVVTELVTTVILGLLAGAVLTQYRDLPSLFGLNTSTSLALYAGGGAASLFALCALPTLVHTFYKRRKEDALFIKSLALSLRQENATKPEWLQRAHLNLYQKLEAQVKRDYTASFQDDHDDSLDPVAAMTHLTLPLDNI